MGIHNPKYKRWCKSFAVASYYTRIHLKIKPEHVKIEDNNAVFWLFLYFDWYSMSWLLFSLSKTSVNVSQTSSSANPRVIREDVHQVNLYIYFSFKWELMSSRWHIVHKDFHKLRQKQLERGCEVGFQDELLVAHSLDTQRSETLLCLWPPAPPVSHLGRSV